MVTSILINLYNVKFFLSRKKKHITDIETTRMKVLSNADARNMLDLSNILNQVFLEFVDFNQTNRCLLNTCVDTCADLFRFMSPHVLHIGK